MKIKYKFSNCGNFIKGNKSAAFVLFMACLLVLSFLLSYSLISCSQKKENEQIKFLTSEVERLNEELNEKNAELDSVKAQLATQK